MPDFPDAPCITFLDDDRMMRLMWLLLSRVGPAEKRWLREYFAPERIDLRSMLELGAGLRKADGAIVMRPGAEQADPPPDSHVLVFRRGVVTRPMIEGCSSLRLIQRLGESSSSIDLDAARNQGVTVSCLPRPSLEYTAEHVLMLMLAVSKKLVLADRAIRSYERPPTGVVPPGGNAFNWVGLTGIGALYGRTLGIVGLGEVGRRVARRAQAFGMRLLYSNRTRLQRREERLLKAEFRPLAELLEEAQFVSLHVPPTASSSRLIGAAEIARMGPESFLINTGHGSVVDEDALYDALVEQRIAGAALDVHAVEPRPASDRFCQLDNVLLTPHIGGTTRLAAIPEIEAMFENIRAALNGQPPPHGRVA